jgi:hypothetical protein
VGLPPADSKLLRSLLKRRFPKNDDQKELDAAARLK